MRASFSNFSERLLVTISAITFVVSNAVAATSTWTGPGSDFNTAANWSNGVPTDAAAFGTASPTSISISASTPVNSLMFNAGASAYTMTVHSPSLLILSGQGIVNNSAHSQTFNIQGIFNFNNSATAASAVVVNSGAGSTQFFGSSTAGTARITNGTSGTQINFTDTSNAGHAVLTVDFTSTVNFGQSSDAQNSTVSNTNGGFTDFFGNASAGSAHLLTDATSNVGFSGNSNGGDAIIDNGGTIDFGSTASARNATFNNTGTLNFVNSSSLGDATVKNTGNAAIFMSGTASMDDANISNADDSQIGFEASNSVGHSTLINHDRAQIQFDSSSSADHSTIVNNDSGYVQFAGNATVANATIMNNDSGDLEFFNNATLGSGTIVNEGQLDFSDSVTGGNSTLENINDGDVDFTQMTAHSISFGSLAGSGSFELGATNITTGSNNASTEISGPISGSGSFTKIGSGILTLSGIDTYAGQTSVIQGGLNLTGSITSPVTVAPGAFLTGNGTLLALINNGTVSPGVSGGGFLKAQHYSGTGTLSVSINGSVVSGLTIIGSAVLPGSKLSVTGANFLTGPMVVLSAGTVIGQFDSVTLPSSPFLTFTPLYTSNSVIILINDIVDLASAARTNNQKTTVSELDSLKKSTTNTFTHMIDVISTLSGGEAREAFNHLSGDALASFSNENLSRAADFLNGINGHARLLGDTDASDMSTKMNGNGSVFLSSASDVGFWAQGTGNFNNIQADNSIGSPGVHSLTSGFQTGYDFAPVDRLRFGISASYEKTNLDVDNRDSTGDLTFIASGLYAHYSVGQSYLTGSFSYASITNNMTRNVVFPGFDETTNANFPSAVLATSIEAGHAFFDRNYVSTQPYLSLRQSYFRQESFSETGAPASDLATDSLSLNSLVSNVGVLVSREFFKGHQHSCTVSSQVSWQHELQDADSPLDVHFQNSGDGSYQVNGTPRDRNAAVLGIGARLRASSALEFYGRYSALLESNQDAQDVSGGMTVRWGL